jgi:flagellin
MGLRIATNMPSITAQRQLRLNSTGVERSMERLSSGIRINKASDDVAGLAISESMRGSIRGLSQALRNAQDGVSFVQVADGGLSESTNIMVRIRELATQAASDTIGDAERGFVNVEVTELTKELDRIARTTEYSGARLLDGSAPSLDFQVGIRGGEMNRITYQAGETNATASALGIESFSVATKDDARAVLEEIDPAISKVAAMRANFGAIQSRMQSSINNIETYRENLTASNSRIRDADMAEESSNLAKQSILQQAGVSTLAQANTSTALAVKLIS